MSLDLATLWFILIGVLLCGYAILDGFDLGVGMLLLRTKDDTERRLLLNAIGPLWDGNEVWLLVGGGAMFAAFPDVYATVFSGFYLPFMLLLAALIFRAAAIEFRSREASKRWRNGWDISFSVASFVIALLTGVALSNIAVGIPIDATKEYTGGFFNLLHPHALMLGVTTIMMFMMHGALYTVLKTEGALQEKAKVWAKQAIWGFVGAYVLLTVVTMGFAPMMLEKMINNPWMLAFPALTFLAIFNIPREFTHGHLRRAFLFSSMSIVFLLCLFGLTLYPNMVPSNLDPAHSLTIFNAVASQKTLEIMTIIAAIGVPFVVAYTIAIQRVFRGKVDPNHLHY